MEIYVQSRGCDRERDYRWVKVSSDESTQPQVPPLSQQAISSIQNDSSSVLLERLSEGSLLLLITGLEPEGRWDFVERQIRIDVVWVGEESDRVALRMVAARALQEEERKLLTKAIANAVQLVPDSYGFQPCFRALESLVLTAADRGLEASKMPDSGKKLGNNVAKLRAELAEELQQCHLPLQVGPLVVVTGFKKRETLESLGIWRGLSKLVDGDEWKLYLTDRSPDERDWVNAMLSLGQKFLSPWLYRK